MSQAAFQTAFARLVIDTEFRLSVAEGGVDELGNDLTERELRRLAAIASQPGIEITATLYEAWRLTKVLTLLPRTAARLGTNRLANELRAFWTSNPATTLYFVEECLAFCEFLDARLAGDPVAYAADLLGFERAKLELHHAATWTDDPPAVRVVLTHDPRVLLEDLVDADEFVDIPAGEFVLEGSLDTAGDEHWHLVM